MDAEQWEVLVRRLEKVARKDPAGYRRRAALLAALGFVYLGAVLVVLVAGSITLLFHALTSSPVLLKFALPLGALALLVLRAAWVPLRDPDGIPVARADAPALHRLIDEVRGLLAVKPIDRVLIVEELNAAVAQTPRWGLFGPQRSTLLIGLPLLQALPERELRAVIAHELGHLSGNHSRFAGWIYRLRATWGRLLDALEQDRHVGAFIFRRFFEWYAPYFSAYTFALARDDEYVADRAAAEAAGTQNAANALVRVRLAVRFDDERHWAPLLAHAASKATPPQDAISARGPRLRAAADDPEATRWLTGALSEVTDHADTHPALGDRLTALGVPPGSRVAVFEGPTAAETLLGPLEAVLAKRFDAEWRDAAQPWWKERHDHLREGRELLAAFEGRDDLDPDEAFEQARMVATLEGDDAAYPLLKALVAEHPDHARARYAFGCVRLDQGDEEGLAELDAAIRLDREAVLPCCEAAIRFLEERGRADDAAAYHDLARHESRAVAAAYEERSRFDPDERVRPYEPTAEERAALHAALAAEKKVAAAYLVQKDVEDHPGVPPLLVVGVHVPHHPLRYVPDGADEELAARVAERLELDQPFCVVTLNGQAKRLRERLERAVAPVYAA